MGISISRCPITAALTLGLAGSLGISATSAFASAAKTASGTISSVTAKSDHLVVKVGKVGTKSDSFTTTAMSKIDLGSKKSVLDKLKVGDEVTVTYTAAGKILTATSVDATA
jgi:hypothetical protein